MKKNLKTLMFIVICVTALSSCRRTGSGSNISEGSSREGGGQSNFVITDEIVTVTRESGSGTRGAFIDLFDIEERNENGGHRDLMTDEAITIGNTAVMLSTVAGNRNAIGYVSLGSLNDTVKAININDVEVNAENIRNGKYEISRPFLITTKVGLSDVAQDFISYIMSKEGQEVVEESGYVSIDHTEEFVSEEPSGRIVIVGSSSVGPVMEKLKEAYERENPNVVIEMQLTDSSVGITSTISGTCDIGMASRELSESELEAGLIPTIIALDGIAVIVNTANPLNNLEKEDVMRIFKGEKITWEGLVN